jgi:spore cortex biosynthesis protein YabQ
VVKIEPVSVQLENFVVTVMSGILIGLMFDGYRVLRGIVKPKIIFTDIGDLLFWLVATFLVFGALLFANWGEVRLYVFIGIMVGIFLYAKLLSKPITYILLKVWRLIVTVMGFVIKIFKMVVWYPVRWVIRVLFLPFYWFYQKPCCYVMDKGRHAGRKYKQAIVRRWFTPKNPPEDPPEAY